MLALLGGMNLLQVFLGWEAVGLASFLLISFWSSRIATSRSGLQALVVNKVGDAGLLLMLATTYFHLCDLSLGNLLGLIPHLSSGYASLDLSFGCLCSLSIFVAATGKSAQLGLHSWLPSAMEGPTPVSALIHAATMVTAGVFLVLRSSPVIHASGTSLICLVLLLVTQ